MKKRKKMELSDIKKIALAGFLHDIGKFRERGGKKVSDALKMKYCSNYKSNYFHIHAAHTAETIDEMKFNIDKKLKDELIYLAASHHLKDIDGDAEIIKKANEYAGRLDREEKDKKDENFDLLRPLITPFSYIELEEDKSREGYYRESYYPLQKLEGKIKSTYQKINSSQKEYEKLYKEFIKEIKQQNFSFKKDEDFLILKSIFEKYTSFIPSATFEAYPDVSLFDHSLATAAVAVAIKKGDGENFSLIQGDFTSIQSFIFSKFGEKNKYLAKILRAKSFFVNIVTELVSLKIIKALELTPFNIVMNAGGKFTILTHKLTDEDKEKLNEIKEWVNKEFENINFLQTKFIIETENFTEDEFSLGKFSNVFKRLAYKFEKAKLKFIPSKNVFENYIENAKNGICEICGIVPLKKEKEDDEKICEYCAKFKSIGEKLPNAAYVGFDLDNILSIKIITNKNNKKEIKKELEKFDFYFGLKDYPVKRIANYVPVFSKEDLESGRYELIKEKFDEKDTSFSDLC
jgi:CRISPR-associated protein Csm1